MILGTVNQLYDDVRAVAEREPSALADDGMAAIFNANLEEARIEYPEHPILKAIPKASSGTTRFNHLLVRVGQLKQVLEDGKPARKRRTTSGMA